MAAVLWLIAGYTHYRFFQSGSAPTAKDKIEAYLQHTEAEINQIVADSGLILSLTSLFPDDDLDVTSMSHALDLSENAYTFFIFNHRNRLLYWSNDKAKIPSSDLLTRAGPLYNDDLGTYRIIKKNIVIGRENLRFITYVPIFKKLIDNPFGHISRHIPPSLTLSEEEGLPILSTTGEELLYIQDKNSPVLSRTQVLILLVLYTLAFLALGIAVMHISHFVRQKLGAWASIAFIAFTAVVLRLITLVFDFSQHFESIPIFDASLMSPGFKNSLGNILVNIVIFLWVSIYTINYLPSKFRSNLSQQQRVLIAATQYFIIFLGTVLLTKFCGDIIQYTSIDFDFDSVFNLDTLSIAALIGVILLLFAQFLWSVKLMSIVTELNLSIPEKLVAGGPTLLLTLPILYFLSPSIPIFQFVLVATIYILLLDLFLEVNTPNFTWIVLWLVVLAGFSSIMLFKYNNDKTTQVRLQVAKQLTEQVDSVALNEISDVFSRADELGVMRNDSTLRRSIRNILEQESDYLTTYYNYSFSRIRPSQTQEQPLKYGELNYYEDKNALDRYIFPFGTRDEGSQFVILEKKKVSYDNPLTSILPIIPFKGIELLEDYDYAIYKGRQCIERSSPDYQMVLDQLPPVAGQTAIYHPVGRSELLYNNGSYTTIVGRKLTGLIKPVSLFSYLFVIVVFIILFLVGVNSIYEYLPPELNLRFSSQISLRNKIQVSVLALIVLSFIIIGIVTVFYFQNTAEKKKIDTLKQTASSLQYEIQSSIIDENTGTLNTNLKQFIQSLAIKYNSHIQVYDRDGILVQASDEKAQNRGYLSDRISIEPLISLKKFDEPIFIHTVDSEALPRYFSAYLTIKSSFDKLIGYVGLPIYPNEKVEGNEVKDFMGTLLNVYVFLLLIAGAFALAVANSITRPMTVLGQKLKDFKLGKSNEPIVWKAKDELGLLIQEYNQMIVKLDESADLLALTEREVAWREMAKQVAHEIKNPLTPMRLSIQHLQHAMQKADPIESRQLVQRVGITLIEQIDNLSRIAAEFSTFAKMPKPQYERIILNDLVASVHDLFKKRDDMDFNLYVPIDEIYVNADKSHLLRVLNNLIKNAIQAIPASRRGIIDIKLDTRGDWAVIQVVDNGKGISKDMREKVFYPNFTTKTSGTGLGLAISKNIIESFGGKIYFETEEHVGTKFYFELPLLKNIESEYPFRHRFESNL